MNDGKIKLAIVDFHTPRQLLKARRGARERGKVQE